MSTRLPLTDIRRIKARDNKLWRRDKKRARLYGLTRIACPCTQHNGVGRAFGLDEVLRHLVRYGRSPECRTSRYPEEPDSSDDEWEAAAAANIASASTSQGQQDRDSGVQVRQMVSDMLQQVQEFAETEERINDIAMNAMETVDNITGINVNQDQGEAGQSIPPEEPSTTPRSDQVPQEQEFDNEPAN